MFKESIENIHARLASADLKKRGHVLRSLSRNPVTTIAGLIAISYAGSIACENTARQTPDLNRAGLSGKTITSPTSTPGPQPWILVPTNTLAPVIRPTETPIPTVVPAKAPETTPQPNPTSTLRPTPAPESIPLPAPEVEKITYLTPGESISWTTPLTNITGKSVKRMIDVVFEKGDTDNIKTEIRLSNEPQIIHQEGSEISIPQGATMTTTMTVRSGASQTCFGEINLLEYSRETGYTDLPINKTILAEKICIPDSIQVFFSYHKPQGRDVFSEITFLNTGSIEQNVTFWVPQEKCYKAGQRDFLQDNKSISELRVKIPARRPNENYGILRLTMYTILSFDENRTPLPTCSIEFNPI